MSFKFDQEYVDALKKHDQEFKDDGYTGFTTVYNAYLDWMEGNALCACDHGCNQTSLENTAKMIFLARASQVGVSDATLEELALKDPKAFVVDLHKDMWTKALARKVDRATKA